MSILRAFSICISYNWCNNYQIKWFAKRKSIGTLIKELLTKEESILSDSDALQKAEDAQAALAEAGTDEISYGYFSPVICYHASGFRNKTTVGACGQSTLKCQADCQAVANLSGRHAHPKCRCGLSPGNRGA